METEEWERGEEPFNVGKCKCVGETKMAIRVEGKFRDGAQGSMWCPKSVLHKKSKVRKKGDEGAWIVKTWWGEKNL
jgi:hypothetical protein